ncbi:MAG: universal stress protein [Desulfobacterales bacterium]|nr:universal stress protein [Desulfobacterales bacterium]MCF8078103.1 universal stress protein [Desulfobacterales bacterium]
MSRTIDQRPRVSHILLATDLSENANLAFSYATSLAVAYGARITVLHVVEKLPPNAELLMASFLEYRDVEEFREKSGEELAARIKARIERFCSDTAAQMPDCRLIFQKVVVEPGNADERIAFHASAVEYDVLVMGSRGHGLIKESLIGGTSRKVLQKVRIPVFLIPL